MSISKTFTLAGNATFTIQYPAAEGRPAGHHTYRVKHKPAEGKWKETRFVSLLTGSDNESDYTYLGILDSFTGQVRLTAKSSYKPDSFPVRLLNRILARVWCDDHAAYERHEYHTHHEGKCGRCGRKLTVPSSVELGIGPECANIMGIATPEGTPSSPAHTGGMTPAIYQTT